jgi:hypothetical protein
VLGSWAGASPSDTAIRRVHPSSFVRGGTRSVPRIDTDRPDPLDHHGARATQATSGSESDLAQVAERPAATRRRPYSKENQSRVSSLPTESLPGSLPSPGVRCLAASLRAGGALELSSATGRPCPCSVLRPRPSIPRVRPIRLRVSPGPASRPIFCLQSAGWLVGRPRLNGRRLLTGVG